MSNKLSRAKGYNGTATGSSCRNDLLPVVRRLGTEDPERRSRDEMALKVEVIVHGGVHVEEALGRSSRLEALHLTLASSHRLIRVFSPIVSPEPLFMGDRSAVTTERHAARALNQHVEDLTLVIDGRERRRRSRRAIVGPNVNTQLRMVS
jgi:hypothetical protein